MRDTRKIKESKINQNEILHKIGPFYLFDRVDSFQVTARRENFGRQNCEIKFSDRIFARSL